MKLSIVIPAYNEEKYIAQCIEAVIADTKNISEDIEIIVVNNASTDNTKKIADKYKEVKVVDEPRSGLPMARQAGYKASTGELIANIDADTIMPAGWTKKVLSEFAKNKNLVALSGPYFYYDRSYLMNLYIRSYYFVGYIVHLINHRILKISAMLQGGNFVLRRDALDKIGGFDTSIEFYGEDSDIARRIQKHGRVKFTFSLPMSTSARRFDKEGIVQTAFKYVVNYLNIIVFKKPFKHKYTYVGEPKESSKCKK